VLFRQVAKYGDREVLHFRDGDGPWQILSWNALHHRMLAVASGLVDAGVKAGDCVAIMSENRVEWIYCDFAIQTIGAITVPIYPSVSEEAAATIVTDSAAKLAIASDAQIAAKLPSTRVVTMDGEIKDWVTAGPGDMDEIANRLRSIRPDDLCTIVYTSGTTGVPKGVELLHHNLVDISRAAMSVHPISDRDHSVSWLPYSHVYGRINDVFLGLMIGLVGWISRGPDHLAEELREIKPTIMNSVPRVYEKMYAAVMARVHTSSGARRAIFHWALRVGARFAQTPNPGPMLRAQRQVAERVVFKSLRGLLTGGNLRFFVSGGAGLARDIEEFFWAIGVPILNGWGLTETSSGVCSNTLHAHRFLTVGRPFPGVELKIAEDGEVLVKSPSNMRGYHNKPEATAEVLKDGWFYTGDIGEIDADGFLKITDRKKSLFKTAGGKYIAPLQIEHELLSDPLIARAVVVGEGRPYVTALIVPDWVAAKGQGLDEKGMHERVQRLVDRVNAGLGHWETVKYFTLLPHDFTEDSGELSLKLDVKRKVVAAHYKDDIAAMYSGKSKDS
jgi:long-chain acyl-CoA synthetase